jgi:hypothetical protein
MESRSLALLSLLTVTLIELKAVLKKTAQTRQSSLLNKPLVGSMAQNDDSQEIRKRKMHVSSNTSETDNKSVKPVL